MHCFTVSACHRGTFLSTSTLAHLQESSKLGLSGVMRCIVLTQGTFQQKGPHVCCWSQHPATPVKSQSMECLPTDAHRANLPSQPQQPARPLSTVRLSSALLLTAPEAPVHGVDLRLVFLLQLRALQLERGSHELIVHRELLGVHNDSLHQLVSLELALLAGPVDLVQQVLVGLGILADGLVVPCHPVGCRPRLDGLLGRHHNGDEAGLEGVAIYPDLLQGRVLLEHRFDRLHRDVLTLGELEDVLLAVDELEGAVSGDGADVPCVEPAVRLQHLLGHRLLLVVPREHCWPPQAHLALGWVGMSIVVQLGAALQPESQARHGRSHGTRLVRLIWDGDEGGGAGLGEAIALDHGTAHGDFEEVLHVARKRGATGHDQLHAPSQGRLDLAEHDLVEQRRRRVVGVALLDEMQLPLEPKVEQEGLDATRGLGLGHDRRVDAIKHARHTHEHSGLEGGDIA
mmetsp:Transcript_11923/g.35708  ORF Transcript_11923/g.35708 Transcript_11923/m.35708 type:complete len:457 (+) Transcript_11923:421-1791(+)